MAKQRKEFHKAEMTDGKRAIIQQLLREYNIESAKDLQDALKDLLGGTIKEMMEAEMDEHLGYSKSERFDSDNARNGYKTKRLNSSYGSLQIDVTQDRRSAFQPQVVKKHQKDISEIDEKIIFIHTLLKQFHSAHQKIQKTAMQESVFIIEMMWNIISNNNFLVEVSCQYK